MFPDVSDDAVKPERSTGVSQLQFEAFGRYKSTASRVFAGNRPGGEVM